jgi:YcxB-like protein
METTEPVIAVSFKLRFVDLFSVLFWFGLRRFWFFTIGLPVLAVSYPFTVRGAATEGDNRLLGYAIMGGMWAVMTWLSPFLGARAAMKNPDFQGEIHYRFSDGGIDTAAAHSNSHIDWEVVTRVSETRRFILVVSSARNVLRPLPKSSFAPADLVALRTLVNMHVTDRLRSSKRSGGRLAAILGNSAVIQALFWLIVVIVVIIILVVRRASN